jgi:hypothetical protein
MPVFGHLASAALRNPKRLRMIDTTARGKYTKRYSRWRECSLSLYIYITVPSKRDALGNSVGSDCFGAIRSLMRMKMCKTGLSIDTTAWGKYEEVFALKGMHSLSLSIYLYIKRFRVGAMCLLESHTCDAPVGSSINARHILWCCSCTVQTQG